MITWCFSKKTESQRRTQESTEHRLRGLTSKTRGSEARQPETPHQEDLFLPAAVSSSLWPPESAQPGARQFLYAATRWRTALSLPLPWPRASGPKCAVILSHMDFGCV